MVFLDARFSGNHIQKFPANRGVNRHNSQSQIDIHLIKSVS